LGKWGLATRGASIHLIHPLKNAVLSRNLDQNMSVFKKKAVKSPQRRGPRPRTPLASVGNPRVVTFAYYNGF